MEIIPNIKTFVKDEFKMTTEKFDLFLHPIRLQIITALSAGDTSAKELAKALPDIPQTTLYRHINLLIEGGILEVVDEIPQRGTVERILGFKAAPTLTPEDLRGLSKAEYQQAFSVIMSGLMNDAMSYINHIPEDEEIDLLAAGFNFNKVRLNLSDSEYLALNQKMLSLMIEATQNKPNPERRQRVFSFLFIPVSPGEDEG